MSHVVHVLGAAQTSMSSRTTPVADLASEAAQSALVDAELAVGDLSLVLVTNALGGSADQDMIRGQTWLRALGLGAKPIINVENACAGSVSALHLAAVAASEGPVLVLGAETMWHAPRDEIGLHLMQGVARDDRLELVEAAQGRAPLMVHNGCRAAELLESGRATSEDLVAVAVKATRLASQNPVAHISRPLTADQVRSAPVIAGPLTRPMCCSFTDGAAAVILGTQPTGPILRTVAVASGTGSGDWFGQFPKLAERTWGEAGIDPSDLDLVELHDVTAAEEVAALEALSLFEPGEAGAATRSGRTDLGSPGLVVNPSGGLLGRGHPLAATGLAQVVEVVDQLRGRCGPRQVLGAQMGATFNMGGVIGSEPAVLGMTVLSNT